MALQPHMKTLMIPLFALGVGLASSASAQTLRPTSPEQLRALDSQFLGQAREPSFQVKLEPVRRRESMFLPYEVRGTIVGPGKSVEFSHTFSRRAESADADLVEVIEVVASEEAGACGYYREERLHIQVRIIDPLQAVAVSATLHVGTTDDHCHIGLEERVASFKPDPRLLCESLMTAYQGGGVVPVFTLGADGKELRGFDGNLRERSHPQSSIPVPASLIAEAGSQRVYFVPHLGSPLPREGKLLSCDTQTGDVLSLANRVELSCNHIPAPIRLRASWMDCR